MKKEEHLKMPIINAQCAGIDVGSKSHYVAIGQSPNEVKEFNVYSSGIDALVDYLKENNIMSVAMESTGSYWQSLFRILQEENFEVLLIHGNQGKRRKKTDVLDCQWIQKMHSLGLLDSCFLPDNFTSSLRTITRYRKALIEDSSKYTLKIQSALRLMNIRLDVVINDIMGVSGQKIISAILAGERDANKLASLADSRVRKSKIEIADALKGQYQEELLFVLKSNYSMFQSINELIKDCDKKIDSLLDEHTKKGKMAEDYKLAKKQLKGKNQIQIPLAEYSYKMFGIDLFRIQSVSSNTVLTFISEIGTDIYKFKTSKQFVSWLRLAPNNRITGSKVKSSRTPKGKNNFAKALRDAANTISNQKTGFLLKFFKRIAFKKGRGAAITATARKLATIIWTMVVNKVEFEAEPQPKIKEKVIQNKLNTMQRIIKELSAEGIDYQLIKN